MRRLAGWAAAGVLAAAAGCAGVPHLGASDPRAPRVTATELVVNGRSVTLHLATPSAQAPSHDALVLFASGDGGWFGAAVDMFRAIGDAGYPAVGISTRALLGHHQHGVTAVTVPVLAADYAVILAAASEALHLPAAHPVVLAGWSRGASLAVLIGASPDAPAHLAGVVAIGLAGRENLAAVYDSDDDEGGEAETAPGQDGIDVYGQLARMGPRRTVVIQATGDRYLPAVDARRLFGADTATRRLYEVTAANHRFGGGGAAFADSLRQSLAWVTDTDE